MWKILLDDPEGLSSQKKIKRQESIQNPQLRDQNDGLNNSYLPQVSPNYDQSPLETVIPTVANSKVNAFIIIGSDRPRGLDSGLGGLGASQAGSIDLVAGLSGPLASETTKRGIKALTEKSPELDAARISISQRSYVDDYYHLAKGEVGNGDASSAIAIKADDVRIIARSGIKLVTGTETHLMGSGIPSTILSGIDLIAGNDDEDLQPLVKGDNLVKTLRDMNDLVQDLNGIVFSVVNSMQSMYGILGTHVHVGAPLVGGPTTPSAEVASSAITQLSNLSLIAGDLQIHSKNLIAWETNCIWPWGENWVCSPYNNTN
jgi:hypothetical protein